MCFFTSILGKQDVAMALIAFHDCDELEYFEKSSHCNIHRSDLSGVANITPQQSLEHIVYILS